MLGAGVATLGLAVGAAVVASARERDIRQARRRTSASGFSAYTYPEFLEIERRARGWRGLTWGATAVSLVAIPIGVVLLVLGRRSRLVAAPWVGPRSAGLGVVVPLGRPRR